MSIKKSSKITTTKPISQTTPPPPLLKEGEIAVTGVLREMQLEEKDIRESQLKYGIYQLTQINAEDLAKLPAGGSSLLIEKPLNNANTYLGKCTQIIGKIDETWLEETKDQRQAGTLFAHEGIAFIPLELTKLEYSKCSPYVDKTQEDIDLIKSYNNEKQSFSGVVKRMARVVPDLGPYDYELTLDKPFIDDENAAGIDLEVKDLLIAPAYNKTWIQLEENMGKRVTLSGYMTWGFAESRYFLVTEVEN